MRREWFQGRCDRHRHATSTSTLGLVLDLNNCYLVPALSMNIISRSCLMQDSYSFKSHGCSIYMINIFYGHAPLKSGLFVLNLIVVIHIFIMLKPKDAELIMIVQLICGTTVWVILVPRA